MKKYKGLALLMSLIFIIPACTACMKRDELKSDVPAGNSISSAELSGEGLNNDAPVEKEMDYARYFNGLPGTAVFYNKQENTYYIYNKALAEQQSSPCSSFKIISCLMGLETGAIDPSDSVMKWNGTRYPLDGWNGDLDYRQAFKGSCIWYYRRVIDAVGKDDVQSFLDKLNYGNRDISQWEGCLDNKIFPDMNMFPDLNGFWQESSLQISPRQQVDVMRRIFDGTDIFSEKNLELMKDVMLIDDDNGGNDGLRIYGKTGSGARDESWADAWFVGLFENDKGATYFAVRLNQPETVGAAAKAIAVDIINGEFPK